MFPDRSVRMCQGSSARMFQDRSAEMFQGSSATMFLVNKRSKSADRFLGSSARMCQDRSAEMFQDRCPDSSARMSQDSSARMCLGSSAEMCHPRSAQMCPDRSAEMFPGSSANRCLSRCAMLLSQPMEMENKRNTSVKSPPIHPEMLKIETQASLLVNTIKHQQYLSR